MKTAMQSLNPVTALLFSLQMVHGTSYCNFFIAPTQDTMRDKDGTQNPGNPLGAMVKPRTEAALVLLPNVAVSLMFLKFDLV